MARRSKYEEELIDRTRRVRMEGAKKYPKASLAAFIVCTNDRFPTKPWSRAYLSSFHLELFPRVVFTTLAYDLREAAIRTAPIVANSHHLPLLSKDRVL